MRLEPDVPAQGPAIIRREAAHQLTAECHREVTALCLDHERVPVADRTGGALQGRGQPMCRLSSRQWDLMQRHWSPTTRLFTGAAGGAMAVYGAGRRDVFGGAIGLAGLTLLTRALTNVELKHAFTVGDGRRG